MRRKFRIVYFVPDPFLDGRIAVGALLDLPEGVRAVRAAWLPGPQCVGSPARAAALRLVADSLGEVRRFDAFPASFGPQALLGRELSLPADVADPEAFLAEHLLPKPSPGKAAAPRAPGRADEGQRFFETWQVAPYVHRHFRPRDFLGTSVQPTPMLDVTPEVSHYVAGTSELLLMEPLVAGRANLPAEARDVVQRFLAYKHLLAGGVLRSSASLIAYVLPTEDLDGAARAIELVRGAASEIVDTNDVAQREAFVRRVRRIGKTAQLALN
jgi:hypothetical protein